MTISIFKRKGESTHPCGQPTDIREQIGIYQFCGSVDSRVAYLSLKILLRILTRYSGQPFLNLNYARLLGATHHKMYMSKNATHEKSFAAFLFSNNVETRKSVAVSVDFPAQKPCCFHWTNYVQQLWLWAWPKLSFQITSTEHAKRPETAD